MKEFSNKCHKYDLKKHKEKYVYWISKSLKILCIKGQYKRSFFNYIIKMYKSICNKGSDSEHRKNHTNQPPNCYNLIFKVVG